MSKAKIMKVWLERVKLFEWDFCANKFEVTYDNLIKFDATSHKYD